MSQKGESGKRSLLRSAGVVGSLTMVSRLLGLLRDTLMANIFGTGVLMSAFTYAFRLPNLFRRLFGEGALSAAFVPVFVETRDQDGEGRAWQLGARVFWLLAIALSIIVVLIEIGIATALSGWTLSDETRLLLKLAQIMLPYTVFICLVALCMGMFNSYRHFALPAATPCLLNLVWIASLFVLVPFFESPIFGVAWGILIAGVIQLVIQFPLLRKYGFRFRVKPRWKDREVRRITTLMLPAAAAAALTQVNVLIDTTLAWNVAYYAPAALYYSERLIYLPLGIFATAFGTVLLPTFSSQATEADAAAGREAMHNTLDTALRSLMFIMIPASIGLVVLAGPIIEMLLNHGAFDGASVDHTAIALRFYAPGLIVFSLAKLFVPAFYSMQDTLTPVKIAVGCVLLNICLSILFVWTWPEGTKHAGLACGTVLAELVYAIILAKVLRDRIEYRRFREALKSGGRALLAGLLMGGIAWLSHEALSNGLGQGKVAQVSAVTLTIIVAGFAYFITAYLLRCREVKDLLRAVRR